MAVAGTARSEKTGICLNVNPDRPGSAYGYVDMGGWVGGQAEYVLVPYADWNLLRFPDRDQALEKIMDLTMLSDIFPTGFHGAVTAGVGVGSTVYIAGAGPVGLAAAVGAQLLGAAVVIVGDMNEDRLAQARSFGCETVNVSNGDPKDQIEQILGVPEVDCGVDAVGFEARGHGRDASHEAPATVLNSLMDITAAGGALGIPGLYVTGDPGGIDEAAKHGSLSLSLGTGWAKSLSFTTGQCPVMSYNRQLMMAILHDKVQIAKAVNATGHPARGCAPRLRRIRRRSGNKVRAEPERIRQGIAPRQRMPGTARQAPRGASLAVPGPARSQALPAGKGHPLLAQETATMLPRHAVGVALRSRLSGHPSPTWPEARQMAFDCAVPLPPVNVPLAAAGHTLTRDVDRAARTFPIMPLLPWTAGPSTAADHGSLPTRTLFCPGEASVIATGGLVPDGAQSILRKESGQVHQDADGSLLLRAH